MKSEEKKRKERKALSMLVLITQIGIYMLVPIFLCVFLGQHISRITGVDILFPGFLLLGILAGFRSSYTMIQRFVRLGDIRSRKSYPDRGCTPEHPSPPEKDFGGDDMPESRWDAEFLEKKDPED